jgi:hypothetical protein
MPPIEKSYDQLKREQEQLQQRAQETQRVVDSLIPGMIQEICTLTGESLDTVKISIKNTCDVTHLPTWQAVQALVTYHRTVAHLKGK